jgi:hypothetical protein
MKLDCPVCQIRLSNLLSFEQELLVHVRLMCEHILTTPLGNQLLQAHQA